jgi:hypothetical protein
LAEFKSAGYIKTSASWIQVIDYDKLKKAPF